MKRAGWILIAFLAAPASAEERPSEADMFGGPAGQEQAPAPEATHAKPSEGELFGQKPATTTGATPITAGVAPSRDELVLGGAVREDAGEDAPEDPLKIGGMFYQRAQASAYEKQPPSQWALSAPTLVDGYFDARPNDRLRGFLLGRLHYAPATPGMPGLPAQFGGGGTGEQLGISLDQLWLRFDIERAVFVTAGRQHVKWGPARFWNPTDFLHQVRRDPLAQFDARLGTTMVKLHVPWEKRGWNFYGVALLEDVQPTDTLGRIGGGARAELVFGSAELGLDALVQRGHKPKLGADISMGVGPFDVYAEAALRHGKETLLWRKVAAPDPSLGVDGALESFHPDGPTVAATGGMTLEFNYTEEDVALVGAEYFYNSTGYDEREVYPWLIAQGQFTPFYLGQHYLGVFGVLMAPGRWDNTMFTLSHLSNLSDGSHVARLDYSVVVLTHLRFEAFGAWHWGNKGGEFRFGLDLPPFPYQGEMVGPFSVPAPKLEAGVGLRVSI